MSNFYPDRFIDIHHFDEIKPAVNHVETHVFQQQKTAKEHLKKYGSGNRGMVYDNGIRKNID